MVSSNAGLFQLQGGSGGGSGGDGDVVSGTPLTTFEEHFIGPDGWSITSRPPRTPTDFEDPQQSVNWITVGDTPLYIDNAVFEREVVDHWGAEAKVAGNAFTVLSRPAPATWWLCTRLYCVSGSPYDVVLKYENNTNYLSIRYNGAGRFQLVQTVAGVETTLQETGAAWAADNIHHRIDAYLNSGGTLSVYVDQVFAYNHDISAWTQAGFGLRASSSGSRCEWIYINPYEWHSRQYVDIGASGSNSGTVADPYNVSGSVNFSSADFTCFKRGTNHGAGWSVTLNGVHVVSYGPAETNEYAEFANVHSTAYQLSGFTKVGNEYQKAFTEGTTQGLQVIEDDWRLEGAIENNVNKIEYWQDLQNFGLVPQAGSLQLGQWALENDVLYIRPTGDSVTGKSYSFCRSAAVPFKFQYPRNSELYELHCWGGVQAQAQLYQYGNHAGGNFKCHHCMATRGDLRGITFGEGVTNSVLTESPQIYYNIARDIVSKGVSTQGPDVGKGLNNATWFGNFNQDIGRNRADAHDCEGTMITNGCYDDRVLYGKSTRIGYLGASYNFYFGLMHPIGFMTDGGVRTTFAYCRVWETRAGFQGQASEVFDLDGFSVYNCLVQECGEPTDNLKPNTAVQLRTRPDREAPYASLGFTGIEVQHLTVEGCSFPPGNAGGGKYGNGCFSAITRQVSGRGGKRLTGSIKYCCVANDTSKTIFSYVSESQASVSPAPNCDLDSDYNVLHNTGTLGDYAGRHRDTQWEVNWQKWTNMSDLIGRTDRANGENLGTRDVNSSIANPSLDANLRPQSGSVAIGMAVGSTLNWDIEMKPRPYQTGGTNTAGAFEP